MEAVAVAIVATLGRLAPLRDWDPLAQRVSEVRDALTGAGGVTSRDLSRLRRWADRWSRLRPDLREYYAARAPKTEIASKALWWVLDHPAGTRPPDSLHFGLRADWESWSAKSSAIDLLPRF